jgi:hypothetical protein
MTVERHWHGMGTAWYVWISRYRDTICWQRAGHCFLGVLPTEFLQGGRTVNVGLFAARLKLATGREEYASWSSCRRYRYPHECPNANQTRNLLLSVCRGTMDDLSYSLDLAPGIFISFPSSRKPLQDNVTSVVKTPYLLPSRGWRRRDVGYTCSSRQTH